MTRRGKTAFSSFVGILIVVAMYGLSSGAGSLQQWLSTRPAPEARVSPLATITPQASAATTASSSAVLDLPAGLRVTDVIRVKRVVDGDTIELSDGRKVRYIGMDTPESVDPHKTVQCYALAASDQNKALVAGKTATLVRDVSDTDRYGRLLRYVYVNGVLINDQLVKQGYAKLDTVPPDVALSKQLAQSQTEARQVGRGLWSAC